MVLGGGAVSYQRGTPVTRDPWRGAPPKMETFVYRGTSLIRDQSPLQDPPRTLGIILCTGGPGMIRKEAWPFYRTISGVRLCWELEKPQGPKGVPFREGYHSDDGEKSSVHGWRRAVF